ncbi:MAG: gliding motility-associated C-terminal domain-containing protein [Flavobacteriales bacterium]|nr:gliding motility-associated C-terminal domain-containing protein [Flavobacteriales bacterium]
MKSKLIFIFFTFLYHFHSAQNLVPDSSFEDYESCQTNLSQFDLLNQWYNPTPGDQNAATPDYFNSCSNSIYWGTTNTLGSQTPRTGAGMAGILFADAFDSETNTEFISVQLNEELDSGQIYEMGFWASHADLVGFFAKPVGLYVSDTMIIFPEPSPENNYNNGAEFNYDPQVEHDEYITEHDDWVEVKGCFTATGGENFLTIGAFHPTQFQTIPNPDGYASYQMSYLYIDDVFLRAYNNSTPFSIGNDTIICPGDSIVLEFDESLRFQDSINTNRFVINGAGTYWGGNSCYGYDTIVVSTVNQLSIELPDDTTLCFGETIDIDINTDNQIIWSNGSTNPSLSISDEGIYWAEIYNQCYSARDSIEVNYMPEVISPLGNDTIICQGESIVLNPNLSPIIWNDSSTLPTLTVKESGIYWFESGRCYKDTINISVMDKIQIDLGNDTAICLGTSIKLDVESPNITKYLWQDNYNGSAYIVTIEGEYWVVVENLCDKTSDSIKVDVIPNLPDIHLGNDFTYCKDSTYSLNFDFPNNQYFSYRWSDNTTSSTKSITEPGYYKLEVESECNKLSSDILISQKCYCDIYIADSFSPNGDLKNDNFSIFSSCEFEYYHLQIFNRWGQLIFESNELKNSWNGKFKNEYVQSGVYTYKLTYLFELPKNHINRLKVEKGIINLLK